MNTSDHAAPPSPGASLSEDALLLGQLRLGSAEAGRGFVQEHYPAIYRYLVHLTGRREAAEDLTQETFLQAWRHPAAFEGRSSLRSWLYRIAHREFLQALRRQQDYPSLEAIGEIAEPGADWTEAVALRAVIRMLPVEEREVVVLHYMEGYTADEIARILGAPLGRIKHRLIAARHHLQRELGEGDLARNHMVLPNLRFLAQLTPEQRQEALSDRGLLFSKMSRTALYAFFSRKFYGQPEMPSREELGETTLRVEYTQPGWFEWRPPGPLGLRWAVRLSAGPESKRVLRPVVRERTREAALQALRRVDRQIR